MVKATIGNESAIEECRRIFAYSISMLAAHARVHPPMPCSTIDAAISAFIDANCAAANLLIVRALSSHVGRWPEAIALTDRRRRRIDFRRLISSAASAWRCFFIGKRHGLALAGHPTLPIGRARRALPPMAVGGQRENLRPNPRRWLICAYDANAEKCRRRRHANVLDLSSRCACRAGTPGARRGDLFAADGDIDRRRRAISLHGRFASRPAIELGV